LKRTANTKAEADIGLYIMNVAHELVPTTTPVVKEITGAFLL